METQELNGIKYENKINYGGLKKVWLDISCYLTLAFLGRSEI